MPRIPPVTPESVTTVSVLSPISRAASGIVAVELFMTAVAANTMIQSVVDDDKRGRVMSYFAMFFIGSLPIGHLSAGYLADIIGAPYTFLVGGSICACWAAVFLVRMAGFRASLRQAYEARGVLQPRGKGSG